MAIAFKPSTFFGFHRAMVQRKYRLLFSPEQHPKASSLLTTASTFVPLWNYFLENNTLELLRNSGRRVYVHSIVTGGQAMDDTLEGFRQLAESTTDQIFVVWINEYFGRVEWQGKGFLDMAVYRDNQQKILGSVAIPKRNQDTFGRDVEEMISRKQTFDEAVESDGTMIMTKQRLRVIQRELFRQLDAIPIV